MKNLKLNYNKSLKVCNILTSIVVLFIFSMQVQAQNINMTNGGNNSACSGTFFDPGGTGDYSYNSTTVVHTICSSTPGEFPKVEFTSFDLWTNGCVLRSFDVLRVYDGPNTSSPLIASYEQTQGQGQTVYGSSGCLTFEFNMDTGSFLCASNSGAPGWAATISCVDEIPPTGEICDKAVPFCSDQSYNFPNIVNGGPAPSGPNYGCNPRSDLPNPIWYYMEVAQDGKIDIKISQSTGTSGSGSGLDVDYVMWGPFTSLEDGCTDIMSGNVDPTQASWSPDATEYISIGGTGGSTVNADLHNNCSGSQAQQWSETTLPPAQAGEIYIIVISNYDNLNGYYTFDQTNYGNPDAGETNCAIVTPCSIDNFTGNPSSCNNNLFDITGSIEFDEAPMSGDLIVEDCDGILTVVASAPFTTPVNYSLTGLTADGNSCTLSAYFSGDIACSKTINYTAPTCGSCIPPSLTINNLQVCSPNTVDLTSSIDASSDPATTTFYNSQTDADNATNAIGTSVSSSGSYWVRAEDPSDATCFVSYEIQVTVSPLPDITITPTDPTCGNANGEINIVLNNSVPAPVIYVIGNAVPDQTDDGLFPGLAAGSYTITVTDNNNCSATGAEILTNSGSVEDASFTLTDFCVGATNNATITGTNGGTFSIVSPTGDGATINAGTGEIIDGVGETTYTIEYETSGSCPVTNTEDVTVNPSPAYTVSTTEPSCGNNDGEIVVAPVTGTTINDYSIDNGVTTQNGGSFSNLSAGNYTVYIKDNNGCVTTGIENLSNQNGPTIDNMNATDPTCSNDDGELDVVATGGTGTLTYEWFDENNQSIGTGISINGLSGGDYSVEVTDNNGCVATGNGTLTDPPATDDASFTLTDFCEGTTNGASITGTTGGAFSIVSPTGDGATVDATTGEIYNGIDGTTYTIEYETSGTCPNTSTEQVTVLSIPNISFNATPNGGEPPLIVEFENTTLNGDHFIWDFGIGDTLHDNDVIFTNLYENAGDYIVILTGESTDGCVDTAMTHILVQLPPMEYGFPNIFTPNGDGQNDMFKLIDASGIATIEIIILNRWGNLVFESDLVNFTWNGQVKGSGANCDDGTYFYKATLKGFDGTEKKEHGFVQLSRNK